MTGSLTGKVAVVTGGSSGIGRAAALALGREGATLVIASRRVAKGEETAGMIREARGEALFVKTDVTQPADVERLISTTAETYGRLDCAFNNAGIAGDIARTAECTEENWDRTISVNLKGVWLCMRYEIAAMLKNGGGAIVNNASVAGLVGLRGQPAYSASKGGVIQLTRTAALEYAKLGIRVNAICPGYVRTPMTELPASENPELEERMRRAQPMGRMGMPEEIAEAVTWLCSDASSFVTGQAIALDGGITAQ